MLVVNSVKKNKSKKRKLAVLNIKVKVRESSISNVSLKLKKKKFQKFIPSKCPRKLAFPQKRIEKEYLFVFYICF